MYLVLLGPPGAGKGSQAELISRDYGLPHISTGDMFRSAVREGTDLGVKAKEYMEKGLLVPDDVTNGIVADRLARPDVREGFLLDGYPRTVVQAAFLDRVLNASGRAITSVIDIEAADEIIIRRLSGRRVCRGCGTIYHTESKPPIQPGLCDTCSGALMQRSDDREETIRERLKIYRQQTEPLIEHYRGLGLLRELDGDRSIAQVYSDVVRILGSAGAPK